MRPRDDWAILPTEHWLVAPEGDQEAGYRLMADLDACRGARAGS